ncbi:MAG: acetate uptake transporter [Acidimicrobiales bacterium]
MADVPYSTGEPMIGADVRPVIAQVVADPLPLGIGAFAMTTFALSIANTNVWGAAASTALSLALIFGGGVQLLAGMWEFVRKNTFGATAFSSYGAFWISFYVYEKFFVPGLKPATATIATGVFLLCWTIFTFYMTIASFRVSMAVVAVFVLLLATYILLTIGVFEGMTGVYQWGGWIGVATAAAAWYAATAGVVNETFKKAVIPVGSLAAPTPAAVAPRR